jgi:hypothetical protein
MRTRKPLSGAADWLSLAAAPTFAVMAVATALGGGPPDMLCAASPVGGMVPMYGLMSVFHVGPWLRLLAAARRTRANESPHRQDHLFACRAHS